MFSLTSSFRYYLYREPTDMRKSFDGLSGIVQGQLSRNPTSGEVFIFINRRRNKVKLLRWEQGGFILYYKRLEQGTFALPDPLRKEIERALNTLTQREADIIRLYFGLIDRHTYTLEEIGEEINLTRERVRQIKDHAINKLKHSNRSKLLITYLG